MEIWMWIYSWSEEGRWSKIAYAEFQHERALIIRPDHDSDLIEYIKGVAKAEEVEVGSFTAIGAFKEAILGFYDQNSHEYREIEVDRPCELASCLGNISIKDGEPFVHAHAVLEDENGSLKAGHLSEGRVFAAEVHLQVLDGQKLERKHDSVTDLSLWDFE